MLSFLAPLFLAGAAAAAVPIVLHLLKREPEARVKFAAKNLLDPRIQELQDGIEASGFHRGRGFSVALSYGS